MSTDDVEGMKIRADYRHFTFPYLYDGETQSVTQAYGAQATPHIFIFDKATQAALRRPHRQRAAGIAGENRSDARAALDALLAGKPVQMAHTPAFGCSTKWKSKIDNQLAEMKKIEAEPVNVEMATAADLKKLRSNPSTKVLLVSFWATWCGPCVTEFPDLENTYRMFRRRDFDFVTVATNYPDEKAGVMKILQEQHASGRNLHLRHYRHLRAASGLRRALGCRRSVHYGHRAGRAGDLSGAGRGKYFGTAARDPDEFRK